MNCETDTELSIYKEERAWSRTQRVLQEMIGEKTCVQSMYAIYVALEANVLKTHSVSFFNYNMQPVVFLVSK